MSLSTNSVIHYTSTLDILKNILKEGFIPKYCSETLKTKRQNWEGAYAMVSFCDIPLSETRNHLESYGHYGIGLSKSWAKKNGLNPVLYIESDSRIGLALIEQAARIIKDKDKIEEVWKQDFINLMSYTKNYDGNLIRGGKSLDSYKFYNEREWRFIPSQTQLNGAYVALSNKSYLEDKDTHNKKINHIRLSFEPLEISYLIVKKEDEIIDLLKHLRDVFSNKCTAQQLEVLLTRITTVDHIVNDY